MLQEVGQWVAYLDKRKQGAKFASELFLFLGDEGDDLWVGVRVGEGDAGKSDGEREAAGAGAAGVEVKDAVAPVDGRLVGVATDDGPNACGGGVKVDVVDGMDEVEQAAA